MGNLKSEPKNKPGEKCILPRIQILMNHNLQQYNAKVVQKASKKFMQNRRTCDSQVLQKADYKEED